MSKFNPTESQQQFINSYDKNTLVSASAGSGKTSTMINKLTDMVVNKCIDIRKLLVVTYTNSAGNEMKQKLFNSLVDALQLQEDDEKINFISQQIDNMANCDIGTLHSICKKIIIQYFYVVEQDPSFTLLSEQQSAYLYDNAMNKVFNDYIVSNDADFYSVYQLFNKKRNLNHLKFIIRTIHNYLLSKIDGKEWKSYIIEKCCKSGNPSEQFLLEYFKQMFSKIANSLSQMKLKCENYFEYYLDYVSDRLNFALGVNTQESYQSLCKFIDLYEFIKKPKIFSSKLSPDEFDLVEEVDLIIDDFNDIVKLFKKNCYIMSDENYHDYRELVVKLFNIVDNVEKEYIKAKKQQNALDFSDLEHITLKILENEKVITSLKDKYDYIFIDEYQDINQVQEEIISRIKRENNLFMIGDVKQSIYAFRLSSPEIFINKFNDFQVNTERNRLITLNENFRSEANILEYANSVFNSIIRKDTIGIDYEATSQLVPGAKKEPNQCVTLSIIDKESELSEGQVIANKVGELVKEGFNFRDIAILLRSKGDLVGEIYAELKKYNIPCEATYKTNLFNNSEILVLYSLLKLVYNCNNDIAIATVLKSYFIGLTDDELAEIRLIDRDNYYYNAVYEYMISGTNIHIKNKIKLLYDMIEEFRFDLNNNTIENVLNELLIKNNMFNYYLSFVNGLEKISNIKEFFRLISNKELQYDIQKCVDYLDNIKKDGEITLTLSGVENSVKIVTIHSSKGLEYPAVILGGAGKKFVLNKQTEDIIINDKLGVGLKMFNPVERIQQESLIKNACKIFNKKNEIDEEIRLLYVALTRAKNRLCIVGEYDTKNIRFRAKKDIYSAQSYLDLIMKTIDEKYLGQFENKLDSFIINQGKMSECRVEFVKQLEVEENIEKQIILNSSDKSAEERVSKYFSYVYPHSTHNNIALKNSVSQILREEQDYEKQIDSVVSEQYQDDYSLRLGTAYHNIMQSVDYSEKEADIINIIERIKTSDYPYNDVKINHILKAIEKVQSLLYEGTKVYKETQFIMKANYGELTGSDEDVDVLIQGVIDLVILNGDKATIIDFKTNKTRNKQTLIDRYGMQLKMYADAFSKAYNVKIEKRLLYSFEIGEFIEI